MKISCEYKSFEALLNICNNTAKFFFTYVSFITIREVVGNTRLERYNIKDYLSSERRADKYLPVKKKCLKKIICP